MADNDNQKEFISIPTDNQSLMKYALNEEAIKVLMEEFKRLTVEGARILIREVVSQTTSIHARTISKAKSFVRYNLSKFTPEKTLKLNVIKDLREKIFPIIYDECVDISYGDYEDRQPIGPMKYFMLKKGMSYESIKRLYCDELGMIKFIYDFDNPDITAQPIQNKTILQRTFIQVYGNNGKFDYPTEYVYNCPRCITRTTKKPYDVQSTNTRIICEGDYFDLNPETGKGKLKKCGITLVPDEEVCVTRDCHYYNIAYEDEYGRRMTADAVSFDVHEPGFYECVLFKIRTIRKKDIFHIMHVKELVAKSFDLEPKVEGENYVFALQRSFDRFLLHSTGVIVHGLLPIKIAMILQTFLTYNKNETLDFNIQLIGDTGTGKSMILKYYSFLLNNSLNISTVGVSTSVPALRGTRHVAIIHGKEYKVVTIGYLGLYKSIHIDEAGENRDLVQNLKTFLLDANYSYDRAGADGSFNTRTAHVNLSENLDYVHLGQYRGSIRKAYKEFDAAIDDNEKIEWNEDWDLHQSLFRYTNPYLYSVIKEKRLEYEQKRMFWVDGYDIALHERFPFYFYLTNEKYDKGLKRMVGEMSFRNTIADNFELIKALRNVTISNFFVKCAEHKYSVNVDNLIEKTTEIFDSYGLKLNERQKTFYYKVIKLSTMLNRREEPNEEDYDLVRWFIETTNCKVDVKDIADYRIEGPPNIIENKKRDEEIREEVEKGVQGFGLPEGEFL